MSRELTMFINNPSEGEFLQEISWNRQEFMDAVQAIADEYKGLTYSEEQIKIAKSDRATLNAVKKSISDRRIEVKKAIISPYEKFEAEVKEGVRKIDEVVSLIDRQISEHEEKKREEKKDSLRKFFEISSQGILLDGERPDFEKLFNPKWLNATVSMRTATGELQEKIDRIKADLEAIESLQPDMKVYAVDIYKKTMDMTQVMGEVARQQDLRKKAEEDAARKAEEAAMKENGSGNGLEGCVRPVQQPEHGETQKPTPEPVVCEPTAIQESQKVYRAAFCVHGTREQIEGLKNYMIANGIRFERV